MNFSACSEFKNYSNDPEIRRIIFLDFKLTEFTPFTVFAHHTFYNIITSFRDISEKCFMASNKTCHSI